MFNKLLKKLFNVKNNMLRLKWKCTIYLLIKRLFAFVELQNKNANTVL